MVIRVYWGHKLSNHTKLSYTMMSLLDKIIVNYW